jgi:hypothetical protein
MAFLENFNNNNKAEDETQQPKVDLERIALNFVNKIHLQLKMGHKVNEMEVRFMILIAKEIERRLALEREENTVYWHLRQGK